MIKKAAFIFGLFSLFCRPVHAFSVEHNFTVILGVFNASKTNFEYTLTPQKYQVQSSVSTFGLFDTLYPFKAIYSTAGSINKKDFETSSYKYQSQSRFTKRTKELVYNDQGIPLYRLSSKNDSEQKKVAIKKDLNNKDTTDLQTVFAKLSKQYNDVKFCDSRMEVFDGKRRFDVIFKDEGLEELTPNKYSPFKGQATKCSMYIDKLNSKEDDLLWELTSERPISFWILEDEAKKVPFIARIEIEETPLGKLNVYTQSIKVKD